ncbi:uncharacterized protein LOC111047929 [Nilaparvata lugens]|uniref:uncharacterized protein LOC111047929 n=1 Tax=Nilaparvata lugens TaxID=108931 RepID=UPI00193D846F|nr:uncharacterized protein LOC111047929 [Nilaparvata lugens]
MLIFQTHIIALLSIVGSQRLLASPTSTVPPLEEFSTFRSLASTTSTASPLEDTSKGETREHDESSTTERTGRKNNWDCQAESDYIRKQITLTSRLLKDGEKALQAQTDSSADETVLVLGKAGSGKTSLVQFLTENPKLQSKKVRADTGEYILEDGEKIGTSATESFTLYPEFVNYNSTTNFCDSPGFHDSRGSAHEIVSMDVMKSTVSHFKKVKILLLEKYGSLQYGVSKDNFINTLHHLNDFLVDIDRYRDHIVLIATKIPFVYKMADDGDSAMPELITEEMHIESIMEYLNQTETSIAEKLNQDIGKSKKDFYEKVIKLMQSLQTRDEDGKATRIAIFRRPYKSGPLTSMSLLDKNRESITKTIEQLQSVEVKQNDFDFTLSNEAKMYLECLLKLTSENYKSKINELSYKLNEFLNEKVQNYSSFSQALSELELLYKELKQLAENLDETRNYNELFEKINGFIKNQEISLPVNYNERLHVLEKYEKILSKFVNTSAVFIPSLWTHPIKQVIKVTRDELHWYRNLNKFIEGLSSYRMQKNKTEVYSTVFHEGVTSTNGLMALFMDTTGSTDFKQFIDALSNTRKQSEVETIPRTLLKLNDVSCDVNGKLTVKGFHVILSEINSDVLMRSYCKNITVKEVALLAVDTVFLDEDTIDSLSGVSMFVAAPRWQVIGQRRIVLSGQPGLPILDTGFNGKPGLPGHNGGSFFGVGLHFLNGGNLKIESNGGAGGPGSNGSKGAPGIDGTDAWELLRAGGKSVADGVYRFDTGIETDYLQNSLGNPNAKIPLDLGEFWPRDGDNYYNFHTELEVVLKEGQCGDEGDKGGLGGAAGIGGYAGDMQLIELGDASQIEMQNQTGNMGANGIGGETGERGIDGARMVCVQVKAFQEKLHTYDKIKSYWSCEPTEMQSPTCKTCPNCDQTNVNRGYIQDGIKQPAPKKSPDFIHYLLDYAILLEAHSNSTLFKTIIGEFKEAIQKKFTYNLNELGMLYFKKSA